MTDWTMEELRELMELFTQEGLSEFRYTRDGESLVLKKAMMAQGMDVSGAAALPAQGSAVQQAAMIPTAAMQSAAVVSAAEESTAGTSAEDSDGTWVKAPLAGVFYRAPKAGEKPYVEIGQEVHKGDVIGLVEAMKMMSEIPAPCDGVVDEIVMADAAFAAFDVNILRIREK